MSEKKPLQRILVLLSAFAFLGTTGFAIAGMFSNARQQPQQATNVESVSTGGELQAKARAYEKVLEREPENQTVLQALVQTRLQMNDLAGAIAPMEKLVELNPDKEQYKALLAGIKQQATGQPQKGDRN